MRKFTQPVATGLAALLPVVLALLCSERLKPAFSAPKLAAFLLISATLAALALLSAPARPRPRAERVFWITLAAFTAIHLLSAALSPQRWAAGQSLELLLAGLLLLAARAALGSLHDARLLHGACALAAALVAVLIWLQWMGLSLFTTLGFWPGAASRTRLFATLGNPDFVASFLAACLPAVVALCLRERRLRPLWMLAALLSISAAVLTGARGGVLALACGTLLAFFLLARRRATLLTALLLVCAVAGSCLANQRGLGASLDGRIQLWHAALHGAALSPLGSGPGSFAAVYPLRLGRYHHDAPTPPAALNQLERHAQNDFVEIWAETGWLGLLAFAAWLLSWLKLALSRWRTSIGAARDALAVSLSSVLALCVAACFDSPFHRPEGWALLCLAMSVPLLHPTAAAEPLPAPGVLRPLAAVAVFAAALTLAAPFLLSAWALAQAERAEQADDLPAALRGYQSALRWSASSPDAHFGLTRVLAASGNEQAALEQSLHARRYVPEPELCLLRARILQNENRPAEARDELRAGLLLFPYSRALRDEASALAGALDSEQIESDKK